MFGPYRLDELLGRGGMGEVYRAYDTEHHRTVAIKRLGTHLAGDAEFQARFRREAQSAARLRSPHIVPIHRYGEIDGQLYIDMRLVEGGDLDELIRREGPLASDRALRILEQMASALDEAHENGLVHRDVKPSNILVDIMPADFCYLTDFGVTRLATALRSRTLTHSGAILGSLAYMAPEQFGGAVTKQSDVYSLTCVLFEMLTARKPYEGNGLPALMHAHMQIPPPRPSDHNPGAVVFDDVIAVGMAKEIGERFATAGELARAARKALEIASAGTVSLPPGEEDTAGEVTAPHLVQPKVPVPSDRSWKKPVLATVAVVIAVLAGALLLSQRTTQVIGVVRPASPVSAAPLPPAPPPTAAAPSAAGPALTEAIFTGRTSGNEETVAIGIRDGRAAGYLCDGHNVEAWLEGTVTGNQVTLHGRTVDTAVIATADQHGLLGTVQINGRTVPFSAQLASGAAGLYQSSRSVQGITTRIGWIVLPDGAQVGVRRQNTTETPAPTLNTGTLTANDAGEVVRAERVSGATVVLGP